MSLEDVAMNKLRLSLTLKKGTDDHRRPPDKSQQSHEVAY